MKVDGGCTGTLIAPDVVITAAHCGRLPILGPAWEDQLDIKDEWRTNRYVVPIYFGATISPPLHTAYARYFSVPSQDDVVLWLLDEPVPASVAVPTPVLTPALVAAMPGGHLPAAGMRAVGWGGGTTFRRTAQIGWADGFPRGANTFWGHILDPGVHFQGGDSGGPALVFVGAQRYLAGVYQGDSGDDTWGSYLGTFKRGDAATGKADIASWLARRVGNSSVGPSRERFVPHGNGDLWAPAACFGSETCLTGDVDGDLLTDTIAVTGTGAVYVGINYGFRTCSTTIAGCQASANGYQSGVGFGVGSTAWLQGLPVVAARLEMADLDRDGRDDLLAFRTEGVYYARSTGTGFAAPVVIGTGLCAPATTTCIPGFVTGTINLVEIETATGALRVFARGAGGQLVEQTFATSTVTGRCPSTATCQIADVDADGRGDLVIIDNDATGEVWVARNTYTGFAAPSLWVNYACAAGRVQTCRVGDIDGDSRADLVVFDRDDGDIIAFRHYGSVPVAELQWHTNFCLPGEICTTGYVDRDELVDVIAFVHGTDPTRPGQVKIATSIASFEK